jgi:hypothetical protein
MTISKRWMARLVLAMTVLLVATGTPVSSAAPPAYRSNFLIPAYFYPSGSKWQDMCASLRSYVIRAALIMNPDSGPGARRDNNYTTAITSCHIGPYSQQIIGYVDTAYGARSAAIVKADIDKYYAWYAVNGIFFDQMSNNSATKPYYLDLYNYVNSKAASALVVGNPGVPASTAWQLTAPPVVGLLVVFEGSAKDYVAWTPPAWITAIGSPSYARFAHLVYGSGPTSYPVERPGLTPSVKRICNVSTAKKGGYMDVTPDNLVPVPNPWDSLPNLAGMKSYCSGPP